MDNQRGNTWSKNHESLDTCGSCPEFWHFSWDDSALHDLPAQIDYVIDQTGFDDMFYIGYSMGNSRYFTLLTNRPEYNEKIRAGYMMAPPIFMTNANNGLANQAEAIQDALHAQGIYEVYGRDPEAEGNSDDWRDIHNSIYKSSNEQYNETMRPIYEAHAPAGTSTYTFVHYSQLHLLDYVFQRYNWHEENMAIYGQEQPPVSNFSLVTAPTALYVGDEDLLATVADNNQLAPLIPNLIEYHIVEYEGWEHADFCYGIDADSLVYSRILNSMETFK